MIDTQHAMPGSQFAALIGVEYGMLLLFVAVMVWLIKGKEIRRWWRRRKLNIPEENGVKTITGPTWEIVWIKTSEVTEKRPDEVRTTVLGHDLPEVVAVLKARYGDEFDEANVRSASKQSYSSVLVGIPEGKP